MRLVWLFSCYAGVGPCAPPSLLPTKLRLSLISFITKCVDTVLYRRTLHLRNPALPDSTGHLIGYRVTQGFCRLLRIHKAVFQRLSYLIISLRLDSTVKVAVPKISHLEAQIGLSISNFQSWREASSEEIWQIETLKLKTPSLCDQSLFDSGMSTFHNPRISVSGSWGLVFPMQSSFLVLQKF